jgi:hypothetical protein
LRAKEWESDEDDEEEPEAVNQKREVLPAKVEVVVVRPRSDCGRERRHWDGADYGDRNAAKYGSLAGHPDAVVLIFPVSDPRIRSRYNGMFSRCPILYSRRSKADPAHSSTLDHEEANPGEPMFRFQISLATGRAGSFG